MKDNPPPFFKSWKNMYLLVFSVLVLLIVFFTFLKDLI